MTKRRVVQIQLFVLAALAGLIMIRVLNGPGSPDGEVVLTELKAGRLAHESFRVDRPTMVRIEATGSFEEDAAVGGDGVLAAYPWIINRQTRATVWAMEQDAQRRERGTLARANATVQLQPGTYDVFFAAYGPTRASRNTRHVFRSHWTRDARHWHVAVNGTDGGDLLPASHDASVAGGDHVVWKTGALQGNRTAQHVFTVDRPIVLKVYSVGELCDDPCDYGWIENVLTRERVWQLEKQTARPAGGSETNYVFDGLVELGPGTYQAVFRTDPGHAYGAWFGNPPFDPYGWGMTLSATSPADVDAVDGLDLWEDREPVLRIGSVTNDAHIARRFEVLAPTVVVVAATGEMRKDGSRYDYAYLIRDDTGDTVWEMTWGATRHAGGRSDNRTEEAYVMLAPGQYTLHYQTDDSHAFGSWSGGAPDDRDRWGVAVFPLRTNTGTGTIVTGDDVPAPRSGAAAPVAAMSATEGTALVDVRGLGNDRTVSQRFAIAEDATIRVRALGEISVSGSYDYGWITSTDTGETIWQMTRYNTRPGGGDDRNRQFDGMLELPAGEYVVHFKTDFAHAYGDFEDSPPHAPSEWGIRIERAPRTDAR